MLFIDLATQWTVTGMGEIVGLNYAAVEAVMRMKKLTKRDRLFADIQIMELAALAVFRAKHKEKK